MPQNKIITDECGSQAHKRISKNHLQKIYNWKDILRHLGKTLPFGNPLVRGLIRSTLAALHRTQEDDHFIAINVAC